ncbi:MAG: DUF3667 domain-containing protein [Ignavibacteria bacterium]|nr:DUF3667 domain-containing protein [Ignavibacteria bacterium]
MENCLNCGTELKGKFCYNCGQEKISKRLSLKSLFHDFIHSTFHWESSFVHTVKELLVSPGVFLRNFINGKRKSYTKPVSFFILLVTVFVISFHFFSDNFVSFVNKTFMGENAEKYHPMGVSIVEMQHFFFNKLNYFYFVIPPIFALYLSLFFKKMKLNFAEAMASSFYVIGMGLFISLFLVFFALINVKFWSIRLITTFAYYVYALMSFSNEKTAAGFFKSLGVTLLTYITFAFLLSALAFIYLFAAH